MTRAPCAAALALLAACQGSIDATSPSPGATAGASGTGPQDRGGRPGNPAPGAPAGPGSTPGAAPGDPNRVGLRPLRRLTQAEYSNTIRDLLGDDSRAGDGLTSDADGGWGFRNAQVVSDGAAQALLDTAEAVARRAVAHLDRLGPCPTADAKCAHDVIVSFGKRAFRRPLDQTETDELDAIYAQGRGAFAEDHAGAMRLVLTAMLMSPQFLYEWQRPAAPAHPVAGAIALDAYELASRLSYFLWASMPDDRLFAAADSGGLLTPDGLAAEVARMLADAKATAAAQTFHTEWLGLQKVAGLSKDTKLFPTFDDKLKASMGEELQRLVGDWFAADGTLSGLLTATSSYVDGGLAKLYGLPLATGAAFQKVAYPTGQRAGLLTTAGYLSIQSNFNSTNPPRRGYSVYNHLLCNVLPPPPPGAAAMFQLEASKTTRQSFEAHEKVPGCAACHTLIDAIGFAFEGYDAVGRYRTDERGLPIDASGTTMVGDRALNWTSAVDLAPQLAAAPGVRDCVARNWLRFALQRFETDDDAYALASALGAGGAAGLNVRAFIGTLARTRAFTHRAPEPGEMLQ